MNTGSVKFFVAAFLLCSTYIFSQVNPVIQRYRDDAKGEYKYRHSASMNGNLAQTLFYSNGEVGNWPAQPSCEWPKNSGHSYSAGLSLLIAAEVTAPGDNLVIHPLESSYREWMDSDPLTGTIWGLEPVPGYFNSTSSKPALSNNPSTWPAVWPAALGLSADWNGQWYGYFGKGVMNADLETYFVMDDSKDKEFTRYPYYYYPIASDSARGGLGLRVEVRGFQWSIKELEDVIIWHYDVINISDFSYPKTAFGFYTDPCVGGSSDFSDDCASYNDLLDLAYAYDADGLGDTGWKTGYYGYAFLESPVGLSAVSVYMLGSGWPMDDERMWLKMSGGVFDTSAQRSNISMVFASGPFSFDQGSRERFSMALIFGEDLVDLIVNKNNVQMVYDNHYDFRIFTDVKDEGVTTPKEFGLSQNYPNPFNPVTTINYSVAKEGNVSLTVYDALGREAAVIVNDYKPAGSYSAQFNGASLSSGVYLYKLTSGSFSETKKFVLLK